MTGKSAPGQTTLDATIDGARSRVGRNLSAMSIAVVGSAILQYAIYFWIARYLGLEEYGVFSLALTVAVLAAPWTDLGVGVWIAHVAAADATTERSPSLPRALGQAIAWRAVLLLPVAGIATAYALGAARSEVAWVLLPLGLAAFFDGLATLGCAIHQANQRMPASAWITIRRNLVRALAFGSAAGLGLRLEALAWTLLAGSLITGIAPWLRLLRTESIAWDWPRLPAIRKASPFGIAVMAVLLHTQIDVVMLDWLGSNGNSEVGAYHAGTRFLVLAMLIPQVVAQALAPLDYRLGARGPDGLGLLYRQKTVAIGALGLLGSVILVFGGPDLVQILLGADFAVCAPIVIATGPVLLAKFLSSPIADALCGLNRQFRWGLIAMLGLVVNVLANLVLIPWAGALGAATATAVSEVLCLLCLATCLQASGVSLGWRRLFGAPALALLLVAGVWTTCTVVFEQTPSLRLGLAAGIAAVCLALYRWPSSELRSLVGAIRGPSDRSGIPSNAATTERKSGGIAQLRS